VLSADNQQERLDTNWVVGFVDGEGCFHVSINKLKCMKLGWQVLPEFRIVQHEKDELLLQKICKFFCCGNVVVNHGDRMELRIRCIENLNKIVKFFQENKLQTRKRKNFELFAEIIFLMNEKKHLTRNGLERIAKIASQMNRQVKRKYLESPETIRQTHSSENVKI
jgi:hypothetical protein